MKRSFPGNSTAQLGFDEDTLPVPKPEVVSQKPQSARALCLVFVDGSLTGHANFETYLRESTAPGAVPLRFDRTAPSVAPSEGIALEARGELERLAKDTGALLLDSTLVASRTNETPGVARYRVLVIAQRIKPELERVVVMERADNHADVCDSRPWDADE